MPNCPNVVIDNSGTMIGDIAHISAAMPDGPRFDPNMTNEDRRGFDNLMLLCATHHRQVDGSNSEMTKKELKRIKARHEARFSAAEETIRKRFETQFPDATDGLTPTKPVTLDGLRQVFDDGAFSDGDVETEIPKLARYVDKLSAVPEVYRDFMCQVIKRCVKLDSWQFDLVSVPCDDVTAALKISSFKLKKIVEALDGYGLGDFSEDFDNRWLVDLHDPGDLVRWCDIVTFCGERDIQLERFAVDVSFELLDT